MIQVSSDSYNMICNSIMAKNKETDDGLISELLGLTYETVHLQVSTFASLMIYCTCMVVMASSSWSPSVCCTPPAR